MGPSELDELLFEGRSYFVRLTLSSGSDIVVPPDVHVVIHGLTMVLPAAPQAGRVVSGPRLVSLPNIAVAEPLDHRPGVGRRRR
jgi:hypothetical protein